MTAPTSQTQAPANASLTDENGNLSDQWRDFFRALGDGNVAIGDYLQTARQPLGGGWLQCNGQAVNTSDYPLLSAMFQKLAPEVVGGSTFTVPTIAAYYASSGGPAGAPGEPPLMQWWIKAR